MGCFWRFPLCGLTHIVFPSSKLSWRTSRRDALTVAMHRGGVGGGPKAGRTSFSSKLDGTARHGQSPADDEQYKQRSTEKPKIKK